MIHSIVLSGNDYSLEVNLRHEHFPWNEFFAEDYPGIQWIKNDRRIRAGYRMPSRPEFPFPVFIKWVKTRNRIEKGARLLIGSRSRQSFRTCLQFEEAGLPVPECLGYLENKTLGESALLTRFFSDSANLSTLFMRGSVSRELVSEVARTLALWHQKGAYHGDLKWSNLLITPERKCIIIDLDQSKLRSKPSIKRIVKDLVRFYRFGLEMKAESWVRDEFFPEYLQALKPLVLSGEDLEGHSSKARHEWEKKGCRTFQ